MRLISLVVRGMAHQQHHIAFGTEFGICKGLDWACMGRALEPLDAGDTTEISGTALIDVEYM